MNLPGYDAWKLAAPDDGCADPYGCADCCNQHTCEDAVKYSEDRDELHPDDVLKEAAIAFVKWQRELCARVVGECAADDLPSCRLCKAVGE